MNTRQTIRTVGLAAVMASMPVLIAIAAHAQSPAPAPQTAPGAVKTLPPPSADDIDAGAAAKSTSPSTAPAASPSTPPASAGKNADAGPSSGASSTVKDVTVGSAVFGSDGQKLGEIKGVKADPGGKVEEIHVKTGGVLGFGGKVVVVPAAKISKGGQNVQVAMTADEIGKLPAMADTKG
jgi:PRC-barrel domain